MQNHSKNVGAPDPTATPAVYGLQEWADLPEGLLHSVVPLLGSILEVFAFASTCRSWRAAFSSYPSKSTLCTLLPPLLVRPHIIVRAPNLPSKSDDGHKLGICLVLDPANMKCTLRCQVPEETFKGLRFAGSSYGQLIFGHGRNCFVVDVFTGAKVLSPQLPFTSNTYLRHFYSGMLTAPIASPNSHLLVCVQPEQGSQCLFDWLIGSGSWSKLQLNHSVILQIVEFNGQFIAMDNHHRLYTLSLAPHLGLQEISTQWTLGGSSFTQPWLVVRSGMLLFVDYYLSLASSGSPVNYKAYLLDMSTKPATWSFEVVKLENDALFIGGDGRSPAFCCMNPGRWGGRSNCLYYAHYRQP